MKIIIIEDEDNIRKQLGTLLHGYGYDVVLISDFENVLTQVNMASAHLILLDINLPFYDGYYLCREIRKTSNIPIIIVTSRNNEMDELMSMNIGADDFVTKPYNTQILLARIESLLNRTYKNRISDEISYGDLKLDVAKGTISYLDNTEYLSKNELKILYYLIQNKGKIVSRDKLMEYLWTSELFIDDNTLSVNITRVRKKIESMGMPNPIETRRGLGYIMP